MPTDVVLVVVLVAVTVSPWLARVSHLPTPTVQFLLGCLLAALPATGRLHVSGQLILLVVLPVILFWEGYQTSVLWARRYWRPILLNGVFLVAVTAGVIAVVAHAFGFPWPAAWALGAVVAPTDAAAVSAFGRALPPSSTTVLRTESLINDGTALVILAVAIQAAEHQHFGPGDVALRVVRSYGVGVAVGLVAVAVLVLALRHISDPLVNGSFAITLPFLAAVPAEALGGSGVVAVVTCGLVGSRGARRLSPGRIRLPTHAFWQITTFVLGGALFVLTGIQLRGLVTGISAAHAGTLVGHGLLITVVILALRFVWVEFAVVMLRTLDRRPVQRTLRAPFRARVGNTWAGMRGGISLAAALTVPVMVLGAPFPRRGDLLVLTFVVVAATLLGQGATLGRVVRWAAADAPPPATGAAVAAARRRLSERVLAGIDSRTLLADLEPEHRAQLRERLVAGSGESTDQRGELGQMRLALAVLAHKRQELVAMTRAGEVEDSVMWQVQQLLDHEEIRLEAMLAAAQADTDDDTDDTDEQR